MNNANLALYLKKLFPGGLLFTLAAILLWLYYGIEWVEREIDAGFTEQAYSNSFLAAQHFLAEADHQSEMLWGYQQLDELLAPYDSIGKRDTIVLVDAFGSLNEAQTEKLLRWVEQGGTLIASSVSYHSDLLGTTDSLFKHFGLTINNSVDTQDNPNTKFQWQLEDDQFVDAEMTGAGPPLIVRQGISDIQTFSSERGIELAIKKTATGGQFFAITDTEIWNNWRIYEFDHAYMLWKMLGSDAKVWFIFNEQGVSLWARAWQTSALGCATLLLAGLFLLWRNSRRFGPILKRDAYQNRNFLEHLRASAGFFWRHGQGQWMLEELRRNTQRALEKKYGSLGQTTADTKQLAALLELPQAAINCVYASPNAPSEQIFVEQIALLQRVQEKL